MVSFLCSFRSFVHSTEKRSSEIVDHDIDYVHIDVDVGDVVVVEFVVVVVIAIIIAEVVVVFVVVVV